ncbi:hypothetical protein [Burkholderia sp. LMG 32019]|uniref:hypothetical protein n=1 Tax=Burkholderia sp. LMG 32019 TaxID=3158173 RepID=UPI003C2ABD04
MARDLRAAAAGIAKAGKKEKKMPSSTIRAPRKSGRFTRFQSKKIERCAGRAHPLHAYKQTPRTGFKRRCEMAAAAESFRNACASPALRRAPFVKDDESLT